MRRTTVHAGQIYRAKARRGFRYVRIVQVRALESDEAAYALWQECNDAGEDLRGWIHGVNRGLQARSVLMWRDGLAAMPPGYELLGGPP